MASSLDTDVTMSEAAAFAAGLARRATALGADEAQVEHKVGERFELDADTHRINLVRSTTQVETTVTVFRDGAKGSASATGRDAGAMEHALQTAVQSASHGPEDPANGIATDVSPVACMLGPADTDRTVMRDVVADHLATVHSLYPQVRTRHAIYAFEDVRRCLANTAGVVQRERRAYHDFGTMFAARRDEAVTSFNYTGASAYEPFGRLMDVGSVERIMSAVSRSFDPRPVPEKFTGDVIITPECLTSLMAFVTRALSGYSLMAGTSPYAERLGESIAAPALSVRNCPRHTDFPKGSEFDRFGVPTRDMDIIRDGVLENFLVDFYCARKLDREHTAGAINLVVATGDLSLEQLIESTERGIVFSRFSGGNPNEAMDFSGIAKNSFYVEDGEIRYPLTETMVSGNLQSLLTDIRGVSSESVNFGDAQVPFIAASGVTISSK